MNVGLSGTFTTHAVISIAVAVTAVCATFAMRDVYLTSEQQQQPGAKVQETVAYSVEPPRVYSFVSRSPSPPPTPHAIVTQERQRGEQKHNKLVRVEDSLEDAMRSTRGE